MGLRTTQRPRPSHSSHSITNRRDSSSGNLYLAGADVAGMVEEVAELIRGNPLFAEEIVNRLIEEGALDP